MLNNNSIINPEQQLGQLLINATRDKNIEEVKHLLAQNMSIDDDKHCNVTLITRFQDKWGRTALAYAVLNKHVEMVQLFIQAGVDINFQNCCGGTVLMESVPTGCLEIIQLLIQSGAYIDLKNINGKTALTYAAEYGHSEIVQKLLEAGAAHGVKNSHFKLGMYIDLRDKWEKTALMGAAEYGHSKTVQLLLRSNASIDFRDEYGKTAYDLGNNEVKSKIMNYVLEGFRKDRSSYFNVIPKDIHNIIKNQLDVVKNMSSTLTIDNFHPNGVTGFLDLVQFLKEM